MNALERVHEHEAHTRLIIVFLRPRGDWTKRTKLCTGSNNAQTRDTDESGYCSFGDVETGRDWTRSNNTIHCNF